MHNPFSLTESKHYYFYMVKLYVFCYQRLYLKQNLHIDLVSSILSPADGVWIEACSSIGRMTMTMRNLKYVGKGEAHRHH
jgi:hypothetical protein